MYNQYPAEQDTKVFMMHYLFLRALNACVLHISSATTDIFLQLGFQPLLYVNIRLALLHVPPSLFSSLHTYTALKPQAVVSLKTRAEIPSTC